MKKRTTAIVLATALFAPMAAHVFAYAEDQNLRENDTPACNAFEQIEIPTTVRLLPKRYKQEDSGDFFSLREACESSLQLKSTD